MNKNISQLAKQAGFNIPHGFNEQILPNSLERFARGIIRECARVVDSSDSPHPHGSYGDKLMEHFGVNNE